MLLERQFAIMALYDGLTDGESYAIAGGAFRSEKGIENAITYVGRNTRSRILEVKPDVSMTLITNRSHA